MSVCVKKILLYFLGFTLALKSFGVIHEARDNKNKNGFSVREMEKRLSPSDFLSMMKGNLESKDFLESISQKKKQIQQSNSIDLSLLKSEIEWLIKKQNGLLERIKDYIEFDTNRLTPHQSKVLKELTEIAKLNIVLAEQALFQLEMKVGDELRKEADFALPVALDPEPPQIFDESRYPRFFVPGPTPRIYIEPK